MFDWLIKSKMGFLQSVKFIKSTKAKITPLNQQVILDYICKKLIERKADGVTLADGQIKYRGSTSGWNRAIFSDVDCGKFNLIKKEGKWVIVYIINLKKSLIIVSLIISLVAGIVMQLGVGKWWVGLLFFLWVYGLNLVITVMRHDVLGEDLVQGIDRLFTDEMIATQGQDAEKLKNWF